MKKLNTPLTKKDISGLKAGEEVLLSGVIYTARDQAHKRIVSVLRSGRKLPVDIKGQAIYYCGPTPAARGKVIGSCGPTTSGRMDEFTPILLEAGLSAMIGKGKRSFKVACAIKKKAAVYFLAPAGCGALLSKKVLKKELVCFADLGPEAVYRLSVKDFPLTVGIDSRGRDIYSFKRKKGE